MTLSITLGWWLLPLTITALSFVLAWHQCTKPDSAGGYFPLGALLAMFLFPLAAITSLVAWLAWALLR